MKLYSFIFCVVVSYFLFSCDKKPSRIHLKQEFRESSACQSKVLSKHVEYQCTNMNGEFRTRRYMYLKNGEIIDCSLQEYMSYEIGDSVSYDCQK